MAPSHAVLSSKAIATRLKAKSSELRDLGANPTFITFGNSLKFCENHRWTFHSVSRVDAMNFQACCRLFHGAARSLVFQTMGAMRILFSGLIRGV
jgi:hypothetical protein